MRISKSFSITCYFTFQLVYDSASKNFSRIAWRYGDRLHRRDISDEYIKHSVEFRSCSVRIAIQCKSHIYLIVNDDFYTLYYPDTTMRFDSVEVSGIKTPIVTYTYGSDVYRIDDGSVCGHCPDAKLIGDIQYIYDLAHTTQLGIYMNGTRRSSVETPVHTRVYRIKGKITDYYNSYSEWEGDVTDESCDYYWKHELY